MEASKSSIHGSPSSQQQELRRLQSQIPLPSPGVNAKVAGIEDSFGYSSSGVSKRARLDAMLAALLSDPVLSDVPKKPSLADVDTLINLELGSAMRITVLKMDHSNAAPSSFDVAVLDTATVKDLKLAIKKKIDDVQQEELGHRHISWRHVWSNFCLSHNNDKLLDDNTLLQDFGVRNNSQQAFDDLLLHPHQRRAIVFSSIVDSQYLCSPSS